VNDQSSAELAARFSRLRGPDGDPLEGRAAALEISEGIASDQERPRLQLTATAPVYRIRRVHVRNGHPFMVEEATVPGALFPGLAARREIAASITELAQEGGVLLGTAEERISLAGATAAAAQSLGIAPDTPVMRRDRVVFALSGPPVEWAVAQCHLVGGYYLAQIK
jgi:GntR family transcriptional regulator